MEHRVLWQTWHPEKPWDYLYWCFLQWWPQCRDTQPLFKLPSLHVGGCSSRNALGIKSLCPSIVLCRPCWALCWGWTSLGPKHADSERGWTCQQCPALSMWQLAMCVTVLKAELWEAAEKAGSSFHLPSLQCHAQAWATESRSGSIGKRRVDATSSLPQEEKWGLDFRCLKIPPAVWCIFWKA